MARPVASPATSEMVAVSGASVSPKPKPFRQVPISSTPSAGETPDVSKPMTSRVTPVVSVARRPSRSATSPPTIVPLAYEIEGTIKVRTTSRYVRLKSARTASSDGPGIASSRPTVK